MGFEINEISLKCTKCKGTFNQELKYYGPDYGHICQRCMLSKNEMSVEKNDLPEEVIEMIQYKAKYGRLFLRDFTTVEINEYRDKALEAIKKYKEVKTSNAKERVYKKTYVNLANKLGIELEK